MVRSIRPFSTSPDVGSSAIVLGLMILAQALSLEVTGQKIDTHRSQKMLKKNVLRIRFEKPNFQENTTYIPARYILHSKGLYNPYHLLPEPE